MSISHTSELLKYIRTFWRHEYIFTKLPIKCREGGGGDENLPPPLPFHGQYLKRQVTDWQ